MKVLIKGVRESDTRMLVEVIYYPDALGNYPVSPTEGILMEYADLPQEDVRIGKSSRLYINPTTAEAWYEYFDRPLTIEEEVQQQKQVNAQIIKTLVENDLM